MKQSSNQETKNDNPRIHTVIGADRREQRPWQCKKRRPEEKDEQMRNHKEKGSKGKEEEGNAEESEREV